jgi:uncharacterized protein YkwD
MRLRYLFGASLLALAVGAQLGVGPQALALKLPWSPPHDYGEEWAEYLAPRDRCPGSEDHDASTEAQEQTMLCLVNWARVHHGLERLPSSPKLMLSARLKARDMSRCNDFRHNACGKPANATAREAGYPIGTPEVSFGENIAWGTRTVASPRVIMDGWLHSDRHRQNLLRREWTAQGIARLENDFQGERDAAIWVSQFGRRPSLD